MNTTQSDEELSRLEALMRHEFFGAPITNKEQIKSRPKTLSKFLNQPALHAPTQHNDNLGLPITESDFVAYMEMVGNAPTSPPRSTYFCLECGRNSSDGKGSPQETLRRCTGCRKTWYCSPQCQKNNWPLHKVDCDASTSSRTAASSASFRYSALNGASSQIRLLKVLPGSFGSSVRCELLETDLETGSMEYEALSYTWGANSESNHATIALNDKRFIITQNLNIALHYLRDPQHSRILWVDAVCINQKDNREKADQIRQMRQIFSRAQQVLMWVGEMTYDSEVAIQNLEKMADSQYEQITFNSDMAKKFHELFVDDMEASLALSRFCFLRPYWARVWIVQEVLMARKAIVVCGKRTVLWTHLVTATTNLRRVMSFNLGRVSGTAMLQVFWKHISTLVTLCTQLLAESQSDLIGKPSILHFVRYLDSRSCSDDRDKIYAFLGLPCREDTSSFPVDYNQSIDKVYAEFALWHIKQTNSLDVLSYAFPNETMTSLHSWIPDWRTPMKATPMLAWNDGLGLPILSHDAGYQKLLPDDAFNHLIYSPGKPTPFIGIAVDRIKQIAPAFKVTGESTQPTSAVMRKCVSMMRTLCRDENPYATNLVDTSEFTYVAHEGYQGAIRGKPNRSHTKTFQFPQDCTAKELATIEAFWRTLVEDTVQMTILPLDVDHSIPEERVFEDISGSLRPNRNFWPIWQFWYEQYQGKRPIEPTGSIFADMVTTTGDRRSFMVTEKGYMGTVGTEIRVGDLIVVFMGAKFPQVLRKTGLISQPSDQSKAAVDVYHRRGECYLHGAMRREIAMAFDWNTSDEHVFVLC